MTLLLWAPLQAAPIVPDALYVPGGPLVLTHEEQALLAADPSTTTLTNLAVLERVTRAQVLQLKVKTSIDDGDRALAARLYWTRGQVLSETDAAFLRTFNPMTAAALRGSSEQARVRTLVWVDSWRAAKASQDLRQMVAIDDHGRIEERAALEDAMARLVHTPTGLDLTEEFVRAAGPAKISFERTGANGGVVERKGRKTLEASGGQTDSSGAFPWVQLNRDYLQTSADFRAPEVAATVAHELLGHSLVHYKAKAAGVVAVNDVYRNDEANAALVGWTVLAEQGADLDSSGMWTFLSNPEQFHRELQVAMPYYAGTFSRAEMFHPLDTLNERLARAVAELGDLPALQRRVDDHRSIHDHFVKAHGFKRQAFRFLEEGLNASRVYYDAHDKDLRSIVDYVKDRMAYYGTDEGRKQSARLLWRSRNSYFQEMESRINALTWRMRALTRGETRHQNSRLPTPGN